MSTSEFPQDQLDDFCNEVLTTIESSELKLLNWGFVDVRSALQSVLPSLLEQLSERGCQLWADAQQLGVTPEDILTNLMQRRLIFRSTSQGQEVYRSRFAEAIRLLSL